VKPDRVYDLAGLLSPSESFQHPDVAYEMNFGGTLGLLSACLELELGCRVLHVSSAEVYGVVDAQALPLRENSPIRPVSSYAGSKAAAEMLALLFFLGYGLPVIRVRPFHHTGSGQCAKFVCSSFAQ
jgi:GDP-4-dehydro-6-deoxy-D-mannose reductase